MGIIYSKCYNGVIRVTGFADGSATRNESSFAKTIQLPVFKKPDACSFEMRLQNG